MYVSFTPSNHCCSPSLSVLRPAARPCEFILCWSSTPCKFVFWPECMDTVSRKRGRPRVVVTEEVVESRRVAAQQRNARRRRAKGIYTLRTPRVRMFSHLICFFSLQSLPAWMLAPRLLIPRPALCLPIEGPLVQVCLLSAVRWKSVHFGLANLWLCMCCVFHLFNNTIPPQIWWMCICRIKYDFTIGINCSVMVCDSPVNGTSSELKIKSDIFSNR